MDIKKEIETILEHSLQVEWLEIENESHRHAKGGGQTHFKVIIVTEDFNQMTMLSRHKWLNQLLEHIFKQVHALSIRTYTKAEWQNLNQNPTSPICVSKKN